jgi:hypothetical protein
MKNDTKTVSAVGQEISEDIEFRARTSLGLLFSLLFVISFFLPMDAISRQFHVSTSGSTSGTGVDSAHAWSLGYAFVGAPVAAGDTIWIHSGSYEFSNTVTLSRTGTSSAGILYRNYANQRVILFNAKTGGTILTLTGSYITLWGLEFSDTYGNIQDYGGYDVATAGSVGCKFVNCVIHDAMAVGLFEQTNSLNTEVYGCLFYNNGRSIGNKRYGYAIYSQNTPGNPPKIYDNNIFINTYGAYSIHAYGSSAGTDSFYVRNNIVGGMLDRNTIEVGCEVEGTQSHGSRIDSNYIYSPFNLPILNPIFQEYGGGIASPLERGNTIIGGMIEFNSRTTNRTFAGNTIYGTWPMVMNWGVNSTQLDTSQYPGNYLFIQAGIGAEYPSRKPPLKVMITQNKYEPSKFYVGVWNPDSLSAVSLDMTGRLAVGTPYIVTDAQSYHAESDGSWKIVASGTYNGGSIVVPMTGTSVPAWVTLPNDTLKPLPNPAHLDRKFGAFIVIGGGIVPPNAPSGSLTVSRDTLPANGGDVSISWESQNCTSASIDLDSVPLRGSEVFHLSSTHVFTLALLGPGGVMQYTRQVFVPAALLPPPIPIDPTPSGGSQEGTLRFRWYRPSITTTQYWFEISLDSSFANASIDSTVTDTTTVRTGLTGGGTVYYWRVRGKDASGWGQFSQTSVVTVGSITAVAPTNTPLRFGLQQNYPNPFNPSTVIRYSVPTRSGRDLVSAGSGDGQSTEDSKTSLVIYDVLGREVATLVNGREEAGTHQATWNAKSVASGMYIARLNITDVYGRLTHTQSIRMVLMR